MLLKILSIILLFIGIVFNELVAVVFGFIGLIYYICLKNDIVFQLCEKEIEEMVIMR